MSDTSSTPVPQNPPSDKAAPRPGESEIAWVMRLHDQRAGSGLTEGDRQAIAVDDHARTEQQLIAALAINADLLQEHDRMRAEMARLRVALTAANAHIAELQEQLDDSRVATKLWAEIAA